MLSCSCLTSAPLSNPTSLSFLKACGFEEEGGSGEPCVITKSGAKTYNTVGTVTMAQVEEIAKTKLPDLNTNKLQSAMNTVKGTAKNMGIKVVDDDDKYWEN